MRVIKKYQLKQILTSILLGGVMLGGAVPAHAAEVEGVRLIDRVRIADSAPELVLNGAGVRTRFFFRVYVGALYLPQKSAAAPAIIQDAGARRIALHMLRELSAEQFIGALEDGLQKNHAADELAKLNPRVQQLRAIFEAVKTAKPGDVIFIDYLPGTGTRITVNGAVQGMIAGEDFNRALLRIWLGDSPADSDLKKGMLGG